MSLLITNIKSIVQVHEHSPSILKGKSMGSIPTIENGYILVEDGSIKDYGIMDSAPKNAGKMIDATGKLVLPSWCDSHSHIVFAGSREQEFVDRINGLSYEEIAERGGGILNSAKKVNETSESELLDQALKRTEEVISMGTGALEIKSGYALTLEGELKMLRVIKKLKEQSPLTIKATFLGAHTIPTKYKQDRESYIKLLTEQMLPQIGDEGLAEYIDVFCEKVAFTTEETDLIIEAGLRYGLKPKIHTNQFNSMGGIEVSTKHNAISVDHLEVMNDTEIDHLSQSNTIATLLPTAPFFLNQAYPPARKLIAKNIPIALATDYNPGSTPSGKIPFVLSLACVKMKMTPEEAINAATINGGYAMEVADELGSITIGKKANLIITKPMPSYNFIPYAFGGNHIETVILNGKIQ